MRYNCAVRVRQEIQSDFSLLNTIFLPCSAKFYRFCYRVARESGELMNIVVFFTHSIVRKKLLNILLSIFLLFNFLNLPPESVEMLFPDFIFQTFPNPLQNQPRISALLSLNIFLRHCTPSFFLYNYCVILLFFLDWEIFANLRNAVIRFLHCCLCERVVIPSKSTQNIDKYRANRIPISFTFISHVLEPKYFYGNYINTFKHAEFKSEKFPLRRPALFSQTAILSSLISQQIFSLFNDMDGLTTNELCHSKEPISINQSSF